MPPFLARLFGPLWVFRVLWKRLLEALKSFSYFRTLSGAPTYAALSLFHEIQKLRRIQAPNLEAYTAVWVIVDRNENNPTFH